MSGGDHLPSGKLVTIRVVIGNYRSRNARSVLDRSYHGGSHNKLLLEEREREARVSYREVAAAQLVAVHVQQLVDVHLHLLRARCARALLLEHKPSIIA